MVEDMKVCKVRIDMADVKDEDAFIEALVNWGAENGVCGWPTNMIYLGSDTQWYETLKKRTDEGDLWIYDLMKPHFDEAKDKGFMFLFVEV